MTDAISPNILRKTDARYCEWHQCLSTDWQCCCMFRDDCGDKDDVIEVEVVVMRKKRVR